MKISQCMIVKNEEHNLQTSLGNLKGIVHEQIVVDTGSTDNTVEVAQALGATVYHFEWIHDFAAAKNFAIEKATGDWIIFLDADEYFSEEDAQKIPKAIEVAQKGKTIGIMCEIANIDRNHKLIGTGQQMRIFRNRKDLRYQGKIHEHISSKRSDFKHTNVLGLTIWHTGYDAQIAVNLNKGQRNLEMLLKEYADDPDNYMLIHYIGESYIALSRWDEALQLFYKIRDLYPDANKNIRYITHTNIMDLHSKMNLLPQKAEIDFEKACKEFSDVPDFYMCMGIVYRNNSEYDKAIVCLEKYIEINEVKENRVIDRTIGLLADAQVELMNLYLITKNLPNVVKKAVLLLQYNKFDIKTLSILLKILVAHEKIDDVISFIQKIYYFDNLKEKYLIYSTAKVNNLHNLQEAIALYFTEDEKNDLEM